MDKFKPAIRFDEESQRYVTVEYPCPEDIYLHYINEPVEAPQELKDKMETLLGLKRDMQAK